MKTSLLKILLLPTAFAFGPLLPAARAVNYTGNPPGPGNWNNPARWTGGGGVGFPGALTDTATISSADTVQLANVGGLTVGTLTLNSPGTSPSLSTW